MKDSPSPVVAALGRWADQRPEAIAYRHESDDRSTEVTVTYGRLAANVTELAADLVDVAGRGGRVVLSMPPGLDYVTGFLACLCAGVVAVPLQPRAGMRSSADGLARHPLAVDAGASAALTVDGLLELSTADACRPDPGRQSANDVAFLQYTSGSTGVPKGVMVTHANLGHNLAAIQAGMSIGATDHVLVWLPPYHDMGLIGGILEPLWAGIPGTLLAPQAFARRPLTWLEAVSEHRATVSGGPNFAFDMAVDRTTPAQRAGLTLSDWQVAFVGSEPVRPATLRRFAEAFAPAGFRAEAFYPCYGMAESTLIISGGRRGDGPRTVPGDTELVGCGVVLGGQSLRVVDGDTGEPVSPGAIGEIQVRGGSVTAGYWRKPEVTAAAYLAGGWLRTGDLGRVVDGEVCVHGRLKDSVIVRGRNLFPEDIEETVRSAAPELRGTAAAAFGVDAPTGERLVVVSEVATSRDSDDSELIALAVMVRSAVTTASGVSPAVVAFVRRGGLPRTTSGKVRRSATRAAYVGASLRLLLEDRLPNEADDGTALPPMLTRDAVTRMSPGERATALAGALRSWISAVTGTPTSRLHPTTPMLALGLDSLTLAQLQGDIAARLGIQLSASTLAEADSLDDVATLLADRMADDGPVDHPAATAADPLPATDSDLVSLTPAQVTAWYQDQRHPGTSVNVLARGFRVDGATDVTALADTIRLLVTRHPFLRTAFEEVRGAPVGRVLPASAVRLSVVDAERWPREQVESWLAAEAVRPFDDGPMFRASVLRRGDHDLFVLAVHHAAVDLWSASLLLAEFDVAHRAFATGGTPELGPPSSPMTPTVVDSSQWWRDNLGADHPETVLPVDRPRPEDRSLTTGVVSRVLSDLAAKAVRELADQLTVSPFSLLLATWQAVLFGYGRGAVTVGTPAARRRDPRSRAVVGFLANSLPLRVEPRGDMAFNELVRLTHRTVLDAVDHQDLPFSGIVESVGASRPDGRNPLFDTLLVLHQPPPFAPAGTTDIALGLGDRTVTLGALTLRTVPLPPPDGPVDMTVEVALGDTETTVAIKYAQDLFDELTAGAVLDTYIDALRLVTDDPRRRVAELTAATTSDLTAEPSAPSAGPAAAPDVVTRIRAIAATKPDAIAVRQGEHALTYGGLMAASAAFARRLRARGVEPETTVGIALPRTPELVVALLAVLWAGGAYFPLDTTLPAKRQASILADTRPVVLVTDTELPFDVPQLRLDHDERATAEPVGVVHPDQLAYVLFTSGSTGRPKSVALTRRGVADLADWVTRTYSARELTEVLAGTPLVFDLSVFELVGTLAAGGTVVIAEHTLELPRMRERDHVTLVNTVPSLLAELLGHGLPDSVRTVNLAGEPLPAALVEDLVAVERIVNLYGPSEDTTYSTAAEIDPEDGRLITIGRPLPGTEAWVVLPEGHLARTGVQGELWLSGPKLARGYLGRPGLTADRFVPTRGGGRAYRTGDEVSRRHDGELRFLGRVDRQVKLRGVRIELAEVEAVVGSCPGVREAAVRVRDEGRPDAALVAYVVGPVRPDDVRKHAETSLPAALVPRQYVLVERLPRTASDKLDRAGLAAVPLPAAPAGPVRLMTADEQTVAEVWAAVLAITDPDPDADFFAQGGHSLLAMRLLAGIEARTGVRVPVGRLFARPTIAGLAAVLGAAEVTDEPVPTGTGPYPLSPTQERLWLIQSLAPDDITYNVAATVRLTGDLDVPRLRRALAEVVACRDALRTRFVLVNGRPRQELTDRAPELELGALDEDIARLPFDLSAGPAWRARLARVDDRTHELVFVAHHISCDGWSLELLARDVEAAYVADGPVRSAPSFVRWAAAQADRWADDDTGTAWWRDHLAGLPELTLPVDRPRRVGAVRTGAVLRVPLPSPVLAGLDRVARVEGATRFAALTATLAAALSVQSGQLEFGIGTVVAGRATAATTDLFGCVVNTVVLRADLTGRPTGRDLLRRVRDEIHSALAHQDVPFARVVRDLAAGGVLTNTPLFQVMIAEQPTRLDLALGDVRGEVSPLATGTAKFDLSVLVEDETLAVEYDTDLFDESTVDGLMRRFVTLASADPDTALADVDLTESAERDQVARWGDGGPLPDLGVRFLHEIVLVQAARTPDRIAVAAPTGSVSYGMLAERVRLLAVGLRQRGIGAEDRVAICHERTPDMVVAMLGILAAGAAYLPVRLTDPAERRAESLRDADVRLVLADPDTVTWLDTWDIPLATVDDVVGEAPAGASPPPLVDDRQLAYVLYTSGSTGRPKGVAVTHRGALARIVWAWTSFAAHELAAVLAATSLGFDLSLFELFAPLSAGGVAVLADTILDLAALAGRERITLVTAVPSSMAALLDMNAWPSTVRAIGLGGEPLTAQLADRVRSLGADRVVNLYGTTEDSFCSTWTELVDDVITVGNPLPGTGIRVVHDGRVLPPGVPGEIAAVGVGVARGYLGRPGLTAAAFQPDPAGPPGGRLYCTGDRGRWTPRGLVMAGRFDNQVKIRGHRVELGEVEAAVLATPGIAEAAVLVVNGRLVAYVRAGDLDVGKVRVTLRRRLPEYMVPAAFVPVDAMPTNSSGKLDRAALARIQVPATAGDAAEPLQDGTESEIAEVWRDLLGLPDVPRCARFFELGGDSLLAARMTARINDRLGTALPIRVIFDDDRLVSFARQVDGKDGV